MKKIEYLFYLSGEKADRLRVEVYKEKSQILEFVVQYEAQILNNWYAIIRYDTRHGFAHRDLMHSDGSVDKEPLSWENYNLSLTYTTEDLKHNWQKYRQRFEEELNERK
jgi:hypothetical protein